MTDYSKTAPEHWELESAPDARVVAVVVVLKTFDAEDSQQGTRTRKSAFLNPDIDMSLSANDENSICYVLLWVDRALKSRAPQKNHVRVKHTMVSGSLA